LRFQELLSVKNGLSPSKVAEDFSSPPFTVHRWMKRVEEENLFSLKFKTGRVVKFF
jgi:transposase